MTAKILSIIILATCICSCGPSNKIKTSSSRKIDSTGTTVSNSVQVKKEAAAGQSTKETSNESSFAFEFENEPLKVEEKSRPSETISPSLQDPKLQAKELTEEFEPGIIRINAGGKHSISINGNKIESSRPIKSLTITGKDLTKTTDIFSESKSDSTAKADTSTTEYHYVGEDHSKVKQNEGFPVVKFTLVGAGLLLLVFIVFWKQLKTYFPFSLIASFLKKKDNGNV